GSSASENSSAQRSTSQRGCDHSTARRPSGSSAGSGSPSPSRPAPAARRSTAFTSPTAPRPAVPASRTLESTAASAGAAPGEQRVEEEEVGGAEWEGRGEGGLECRQGGTEQRPEMVIETPLPDEGSIDEPGGEPTVGRAERRAGKTVGEEGVREGLGRLHADE